MAWEGEGGEGAAGGGSCWGRGRKRWLREEGQLGEEGGATGGGTAGGGRLGRRGEWREGWEEEEQLGEGRGTAGGGGGATTGGGRAAGGGWEVGERGRGVGHGASACLGCAHGFRPARSISPCASPFSSMPGPRTMCRPSRASATAASRPHLPGPLLLRHGPHVQLHRMQCPHLAAKEVRDPGARLGAARRLGPHLRGRPRCSPLPRRLPGLCSHHEGRWV